MQRHTDDGLIISCDFTGEDWDQHSPMIEGHQGSVLSLAALSRAIEEAQPLRDDGESVQCTLCLSWLEPGQWAWSNPNPPDLPGINPQAVICWDCMQQADRAFDRDSDTDWTRRIAPTKRWR